MSMSIGGERVGTAVAEEKCPEDVHLSAASTMCKPEAASKKEEMLQHRLYISSQPFTGSTDVRVIHSRRRRGFTRRHIF